MFWMSILLWIIGLLILYVVVSAAVKDAIDKSEVGKLLIMKYGVKNETLPVSDEEIEKEFEDEFKD